MEINTFLICFIIHFLVGFFHILVSNILHRHKFVLVYFVSNDQVVTDLGISRSIFLTILISYDGFLLSVYTDKSIYHLSINTERLLEIYILISKA